MSNYEYRRLTRSTQDRKIAGVAGGVAAYFDLDPTIVRLAFIAVALLGLPAVLVLYVALWVLLPEGTATADGAASEPDRSRSNTLLLIIVAALGILVLASGLAWVTVFSFHLLRIGLPIWLLLIGVVVFMLWSRRQKAS